METAIIDAGVNTVTEVAAKGFFSTAASAVAAAVSNNPVIAVCIGVAVVGAVGYGGYRYVNRNKGAAQLAAFNEAAAALVAEASATK